jgi:hypothetical protein
MFLPQLAKPLQWRYQLAAIYLDSSPRRGQSHGTVLRSMPRPLAGFSSLSENLLSIIDLINYLTENKRRENLLLLSHIVFFSRLETVTETVTASLYLMPVWQYPPVWSNSLPWCLSPACFPRMVSHHSRRCLYGHIQPAGERVTFHGFSAVQPDWRSRSMDRGSPSTTI